MPDITDIQIATGVRRELSGRRVDLSKLKVTVAGGVVTLAGELSFVGIAKPQEDTSVEIKFLESCLRGFRGVTDITFQFDNWVKNDSGKWEQKGGAGAPHHPATHAGDGFHCPSCKTTIKCCPCCGEPLVPGVGDGQGHSRNVAGVRPVIRSLPRKPEVGRPPLKPLGSLKLSEIKGKPDPSIGDPSGREERPPIGSGPLPVRPPAPPVDSKITPLPFPPKPILPPNIGPAGIRPEGSPKPVFGAPLAGPKPTIQVIKPLVPTVRPQVTPPVTPVRVPPLAPSRVEKPDEPVLQTNIRKIPPMVPPVKEKELSPVLPDPKFETKDDLPIGALEADKEPSQPSIVPVEAREKPEIPPIRVSDKKPETQSETGEADSGPQKVGPLIPLRKPGAAPKAPSMPPLPPDDFGDLDLDLKPEAKPVSKAEPKPATFAVPSTGLGKPAGEALPEDSFEDLLPPLKPGAAVSPAPRKPLAGNTPRPMITPASAKPSGVDLSDLSLDLDEGLLPPLKPGVEVKPLGVRPAAKPAAAIPSIDEDVPLPPMKQKPAAETGMPPSLGEIGDDDLQSLLPPLKTKPPAAALGAKGSPGKSGAQAGGDPLDLGNPFSLLFDDTPLPPPKPGTKPGALPAAKPLGKPTMGGKDGLDDLSNVDFGLLDLFQPGGQPEAPPKVAPGSKATGKPPAKPGPSGPPAGDSLGLDNIFDLDAPVPDTKPKMGGKKIPDPQGPGDVDFKKFKL